MRRRIAAVGAIVLVAAGCGGSKGVPSNAVAIVDGQAITKTQFDQQLAVLQRTYQARKTPFPERGTAAYTSLVGQVVSALVYEAELEQKAKELGVIITEEEVDARIAQIKQQFFGGNEQKYKANLATQGATETDLRHDVHAQVLAEKIYNHVLSAVRVGDAEVARYYARHKSQYTTPSERLVRQILVRTKTLADQLEKKLKDGVGFAMLAQKYSTDSQSAKVGGTLAIRRGQTVAPFDKVAFSLEPGKISAPVHSQYGWHIIQALGPVKPAKWTPLSQVENQIRQALLQTKNAKAIANWKADLAKEYENKISYQAGYGQAGAAQ
jgi:foldase protein PrsA